MSSLTFGLDIGPTSIGWAVIDERNCRIVPTRDGTPGCGVRIFPEGVDRDKQGGEKSRSAGRRMARAMRRQIARRATRKSQLRALLAASGLLPTSTGEIEQLLALNPYTLRHRGLDHRLTLHEFGRVLIHLNQRRGFLSNRKTDKVREKETKGMLAEMGALQKSIDEAACRTLGEYLARLESDYDHARTGPNERVRHRHTRRAMYELEFECIWSQQSRFHPIELSEDLKKRVHSTIFYQRRMYWPRSVVGTCELEPRLKRCPRADRAAQRFRILQEVNNLRVIDTHSRRERPLAEEERRTLIGYLLRAKERSFDQLRKKLGFPEHIRFNLEAPDRPKLKGHETDAALSSKHALGAAWNELSEEQKDAIIDVLVNEEREEVALARLTNNASLTSDLAKRALAVHLPDGYAGFSRMAIERLLPHLERGLLLTADDPSNSALHAAGYLRPDEREIRRSEVLHKPPDVPNPIVHRALSEVRRVVNALIREYGTPQRIHVELAREASKSARQRERIRKENYSRRRRREDASAKIAEMGLNPTHSAIDRYLLWIEQGHRCAYSGEGIGIKNLFSGEVDIDHILPRWRSLDNSQMNKVVCYRAENVEKGQRTPREWLEDLNPSKYDCVLRFADSLPYAKRRRFLEKDIRLEDFVNRQLADTAYIARVVSQYLRCLGAKLTLPRGSMTAELRHFWGLDRILDSSGSDIKNRFDHRHHAVDAVVIALINDRRLKMLAEHRGENVQSPWPTFREDVAAAVARLNVSHRVARGVSGPVHEDMLSGRTQKRDVSDPLPTPRPWAREWIEREGTYVRRRPLLDGQQQNGAIKRTSDLTKVRDPGIRDVLRAHLLQNGIDPDGDVKVPAAVWRTAPRMKSGVPIHRVRMIEESTTMRPVSGSRAFQLVKPGKNHHITYHATPDGRWSGTVLPLWDAATRVRSGEHVVDRRPTSRGAFVMSLSIGESFLVELKTGQPTLCVVQKMRQDDARINYRLASDARRSEDVARDNLVLTAEKMRKLKACKVTVDLLGRIRRAND